MRRGQEFFWIAAIKNFLCAQKRVDKPLKKCKLLFLYLLKRLSGGMVDAADLKSAGLKRPYGFKSRLKHKAGAESHRAIFVFSSRLRRCLRRREKFLKKFLHLISVLVDSKTFF